jgi:hypothetical protein
VGPRDRPHLTPAKAPATSSRLSFAAGFASIAALMLFVLDLAGFEADAGREDEASEPG